jgi:hypothetical protein
MCRLNLPSASPDTSGGKRRRSASLQTLDSVSAVNFRTTLSQHALQYQKCLKKELLEFVKQRDNLSGRDYKQILKKHLVTRLHRLDQDATFRLFDLPPELRELCFEIAVACASDFRRLLLVSKQVHSEVRLLFYKQGTFTLTLGGPGTSSTRSGDPVFDLRTQYWDQVNVHENTSRITYAETLFSRHHMFCNIRHLSLNAGSVTDLSLYGLPQRRYEKGGSRALFMICTFFAFAGLQTQLQTLKYDVGGHEFPLPSTTHELLLTFWPLKLFAGCVQVDVPSVPKEILACLHLDTNDLHPEVIEACQRFALCYFSHRRPIVQKPISLATATSNISQNKLNNLGGFGGLINPDNIQRLMNFVKRMEWTRAWVSDNGSPPQRGLSRPNS